VCCGALHTYWYDRRSGNPSTVSSLLAVVDPLLPWCGDVTKCFVFQYCGFDFDIILSSQYILNTVFHICLRLPVRRFLCVMPLMLFSHTFTLQKHTNFEFSFVSLQVLICVQQNWFVI